MISGKRTGEMKDALMTTVSLDPQSPPQFGDTEDLRRIRIHFLCLYSSMKIYFHDVGRLHRD